MGRVSVRVAISPSTLQVTSPGMDVALVARPDVGVLQRLGGRPEESTGVVVDGLVVPRMLPSIVFPRASTGHFCFSWGRGHFYFALTLGRFCP